MGGSGGITMDVKITDKGPEVDEIKEEIRHLPPV